MSSKGSSAGKVRLDILVASETGYSRGFAKELIVNGNVLVDGKVIMSPGASFVKDDIKIKCSPPEKIYVSRGGYKLSKALEYFEIDVEGLTCADIGASTGGFTDCLLKSGAKKVYAIDNGDGQLDDRLLLDDRVTNIENMNAKELKPDMFSDVIDFICIDVSFISVTKIICAVSSMLKPGGILICLVKPQFEAGRGSLNKRGIIRGSKGSKATKNSKSLKVYETVLEQVRVAFNDAGLEHRGFVCSPITGSDGNVEYLGYFVKVTK